MSAATDSPLPLATAPARPWSRAAAYLVPPNLPPASQRAFRFHMAFALLEAVSLGVVQNAPLMAVKAMGATDAQLQIPIIMTSLGLFCSVFTGVAMSTRRKKPFVLVPGILFASSILALAWTNSALWFLGLAGVVSIFDFAMRPAVPSILRSVYPEGCRSHVAGTLRQYASVVTLSSSLFFAWLLSISFHHVWRMIHIELTLAGVASLGAFACFRQLPDHADGSIQEAMPETRHQGRSFPELVLEILGPLRDRRFRLFLPIFFLYACGNLFYMGIVPAFLGRDLLFGYVTATLLMHIVPAVCGFLGGGYLTSWFDRASISRSYAVVALLWALDPVLLALAPFWPVIAFGRAVHGPAMVGSMVLSSDTGVHSFARPGADTSRYMAVLFLVNGFARLLAPSATALVAGRLSNRAILFFGGLAVLAAGALFARADRKIGRLLT
jgi:hypothetical protein